MASGGNMIVVIASSYLVVSAVRDLYDENRGTKNMSTWPPSRSVIAGLLPL